MEQEVVKGNGSHRPWLSGSWAAAVVLREDGSGKDRPADHALWTSLGPQPQPPLRGPTWGFRRPLVSMCLPVEGKKEGGRRHWEDAQPRVLKTQHEVRREDRRARGRG